MVTTSKQKMLLKDIAQMTGVSVATVSYVLNGKGRISLDKQREIRELLRQAGYKPKHFRYPVFYISDYEEIGDSGATLQFTSRIAGLNMVFHEQNIAFRTDFVRLKNAAPLLVQLKEILAGKPGAMVVDDKFSRHCEEICDFFEAHKIPAVQVGFLPRSEHHDACVVDNFAGGLTAAKYFLEKGHKKIATIRWNIDGDPASNQKFAGFAHGLREAGVALPDEYVAPCVVSRTEPGKIPGREAAMQLANLPDPPTALFVENSYISPSLLYPISEKEDGLPESLAKMDMVHFEAWDLTGLRQIFDSKMAYRALPSKLLKINWEELGRMAGMRVVTRLVDPDTPTGEVMRLAPKLADWEASEWE